MRDGRCSKCGAATVRAAKNGVDLGHVQAGLRPNLQSGFRGIVRLHHTDMWNFVCVTCGHMEWALHDPAALAFVSERWAEVPVTPG